MDLKEFIKETISAIVTASAEIAEEHESAGVLVSPPLTGSERDVFDANSTAPPYRRVNIVEFDVAVTASQETGGGGKAGLKIFSVEAGVDGSHASRNEAVSRVKFSVPIAL
ncbi:MAG: hypothetical protein OIF48_03385, partial [Silicimonas sp.]|nr:hypothetical protein [Silicimonas sp.]